MSVLVDAVRAFRGLRALVLGDAMLDTYLEGTATRLCAEGPVPVVRRTTEQHVAGGAANTAANLRCLGAEVRFVGMVGSDGPAEALARALTVHDVDDRWLIRDGTLATLHKTRILADDQYVVRYDAGDISQVQASVEDRIVAGLEEAFDTSDVVVISDYGYGTVSDRVLCRLREMRARRPCPLVVDSKHLRRFARMQATVVTPNIREAALVVGDAPAGKAPIDLRDGERIGRALLEVVDATWAAITLAEDGVLLIGHGVEPLHVAAHPVRAAHDVGAGDSFTSALALAVAAGAPMETAARVGVSAGALAVTRRRTAVVHHQELLQRVSMDNAPEVPTANDLARRLERERGAERTIVFTNGVFDILHAGHVHFLRQARLLGDVLVVGINTDRSARRLKGKDRPINSERDRASLVAALESVDHVVLFDEDTPSTVIRTLRPDIHVKGGDYTGESLPESDAVRSVGGRVEILPLVGGISTSTVFERIVALGIERRVGAAG